MNNELIERLAREAGFVEYELDDGTTTALDVRYVRFAALVAEACAEECYNGRSTEEAETAILAKFRAD